MSLHVLFDDPAPAPEIAHHVFRGAGGRVAWPKASGRGLGPAGAWNVLWRLGCRPVVATPGERKPQPGDVLFVCAPPPASASTIATVKGWITAGGTVVATTPDPAWGALLGGAVLTPAQSDLPYAALASVFPGRSAELLAPPRWWFVKAAGTGEMFARGSLAVVHGERQTPERALVTPIPAAPALLRNGGFLFVNGDPFSAFQAWLQGQEPLESWLGWRHRLFWLDELAALLGRLLESEHILPPPVERGGIPGLGTTTVVLRHDLDESRETAYLEEEIARGLPGVHCVLRDRNTPFWVPRLASAASGHEVAFHYNTVARASMARRLRIRPRADPALRPARAEVTGRGLLRQVRWARARGIGISTLHRHGAFLLYPEWIDALDAVFESEPAVLGASSLFRGQVFRWGTERLGPGDSIGDSPDPQFPLWLPFRVAHAGRGGRMLRGWETTSVMESEPGLVEQMLTHVVPGLPQRVLVLGYHPAHARRSSFRGGGSLPWFREVLDLIARSGAEVRTLRAVFEACEATSS